MSRRDAPATRRNREPILAVLERWLVGPARVLEVASGTGQHAVYFAERLPAIVWQPSDRDAEGFDSIEAWIEASGLANVSPPIVIDACDGDWPAEPVDAVFSANMIHIAPWEVALGLLDGAARGLRPGGLLFLYGPFRVGGRPTAPSNEAFDADLRRRDPRWGIRDQERIASEAGTRGLELVEENDLPANNRMLVFRRSRAGAS